MPAILAKKLLLEYAKRLQEASSHDIIMALRADLYALFNEPQTGNVTNAVELCANFIQERHLIEACATENWDVFKVKVVETV